MAHFLSPQLTKIPGAHHVAFSKRCIKCIFPSQNRSPKQVTKGQSTPGKIGSSRGASPYPGLQGREVDGGRLRSERVWLLSSGPCVWCMAGGRGGVTVKKSNAGSTCGLHVPPTQRTRIHGSIMMVNVEKRGRFDTEVSILSWMSR